MEVEDKVTCTACREVIRGTAARRAHYRSDLHRVNLKRKVSGLGPLTADELAGRVQALQESREEGKRERGRKVCSACRKTFSSAKALENHCRSRRHRDTVAASNGERDADGGWSPIGSDDEAMPREGAVEGDVADDELDENEHELDEADVEEAVEKELERRLENWEREGYSGIFDEEWFERASDALAHARERYGLFIPYADEVRDWDGLARYLGQKVGVGFSCMACDRGFGSADAARRHMQDRGHWRLAADWATELGEFYGAQSDDGWVEADGEEEGDEEEGDEERQLEMATDGRLVKEARRGLEADTTAEVHEAVELAVGDKLLGHRSLARYYRQGSGGRADSRTAVVANRAERGLVSVTAWRGAGGLEVGQRRRLGLAHQMPKAALRAQRERARLRQRMELVVGGKNYYTRKARFRQKMAVFNSGYRA